MKTTLLALAFMLAIPFWVVCQSETDKELEKELKDVKQEVKDIFKDLEDEHLFAKVDSILELRWPALESEIEEAWGKAEPKVEEVEAKIEQIADDILKEVKSQPEEKTNPPKQHRKKEMM